MTLDQLPKAVAGFKSLKDTWADTTTAHGRLMLTVLGGLAEFERELITPRWTGALCGGERRGGVHDHGRSARIRHARHPRAVDLAWAGEDAVSGRDGDERVAAHMVSSDVSHFHEFSSRMRLGDASWRSSQTKGDTTMKAPLGLMLAMIGGVVIGATAINHPNAQSSAGFEKRNLVTTNGQKASSQKW